MDTSYLVSHKQILKLQAVSSELDAGMTRAMERDVKSWLSLRAAAKIWAERADKTLWEVIVSGDVELLLELAGAVDWGMAVG